MLDLEFANSIRPAEGAQTTQRVRPARLLDGSLYKFENKRGDLLLHLRDGLDHFIDTVRVAPLLDGLLAQFLRPRSDLSDRNLPIAQFKLEYIEEGSTWTGAKIKYAEGQSVIAVFEGAKTTAQIPEYKP